MALWGRVQARMLPTPAKFHYLFNMRDLSKAREGCARGGRRGSMREGRACGGARDGG